MRVQSISSYKPRCFKQNDDYLYNEYVNTKKDVTIPEVAIAGTLIAGILFVFEGLTGQIPNFGQLKTKLKKLISKC